MSDTETDTLGSYFHDMSIKDDLSKAQGREALLRNQEEERQKALAKQELEDQQAMERIRQRTIQELEKKLAEGRLTLAEGTTLRQLRDIQAPSTRPKAGDKLASASGGPIDDSHDPPADITMASLMQTLETFAREVQRNTTAQVNQMKHSLRSGVEEMDIDPSILDIQTRRPDAGISSWIARNGPMGGGPGGLRGSNLKPPPFTDPETEDWLVWRCQFQVLPLSNQWSPEQAKAALVCALRGPAAAAAMNIPIMDERIDLEGALMLLERKFLPPAASKLAKVQFNQAYQKGKEGLLAWHNRCLNLFRKAFPRKDVDDEIVIGHFADGIRDPTVRKQVNRMNPNTYDQALTHALNEASVNAGDKATTLGHNPRSEAYNCNAIEGDVAYINKRFPANKKSAGPAKPPFQKKEGGPKGEINCRFCLQPGHIRPLCPVLDKAREILMPGTKPPPRGESRKLAIQALMELAQGHDSDSDELDEEEEEEGEDTGEPLEENAASPTAPLN